MSKQDKSEQTAKSGHIMATQSKSKDSEQYWQQRVFLHTRTNSSGTAYTDSDYSIRISHAGQRKRFQLHTANKKTAAQKARDIYRNLVANGWASTTAKKSVVKATGKATTIGDVIRVFSEHTAVSPRTAGDYIRALRTVTASVMKISGNKSKFDYVNGGSRKWHTKIDSALLSDITAAKVNKWRLAFVKEKEGNPQKEESAKASANTYLTGCRSIFGAKVIDYLRAELDLPDEIPFDKVDKFDLESSEYVSSFDVIKLMKKARKELPGIEQDQQWIIFMLAVSTGLRRKEIDLLTWNQIRFDENKISLKKTEYFKAKSKKSGTSVTIDPDLTALLRECHEKHKDAGEFVLQSDVRPILNSKTPQYRADRHQKELIKWLRKNGVTAGKPIHTLRKEVGSIINAKDGLYAASKFLRHADIQVTAKYYLDSKPVSSGLGSILAGKEAK